MPSFKTFLLSAALLCQFSAANAQMPPAPTPPPIPPELLQQETTVVVEPVQSISEEKRALIEEYLKLAGKSLKNGPDMQEMMARVHKQMPDLSSQILPVHPALKTKKEKELVEEARESTNQITQRTGALFAKNNEIFAAMDEATIRAYDKHFSEDDLRQLIAFYHTPVGRKLTLEQKAIENELMEASLNQSTGPILKLIHQMMGEQQLFPPGTPPLGK